MKNFETKQWAKLYSHSLKVCPVPYSASHSHNLFISYPLISLLKLVERPSKHRYPFYLYAQVVNDKAQDFQLFKPIQLSGTRKIPERPLEVFILLILILPVRLNLFEKCYSPLETSSL